jgi:F0F1-type ATP synthase membrane subunit b/b'
MWDLSKVSEFRQQAEDLRNAAAVTAHKITRETLLKLAEEYDRMAANPIANYPKKLPWFIR